MKLFKLIILFLVSNYIVSSASAQANAYINILTQNSGLVNLGGTVNIEISVGNTGPNSIAASKVKTAITVPIALVSLLPNAQQTGLPAGWTILSNNAATGVITLCNGTDVIPANQERTILIKIQGNNLGGPSTIIGQLNFSGGVNCGSPGSLSGDNAADNSSTTSVQVVAGCALAINATAGTIICNGESTTLTALATGSTGIVEYSISGGTAFQTSNTFTVPAGTYTVTVREVANPLTCVATASLTITEPLAILTPVVNIVQPTCSISTGEITITSETTGLTFSVDGGVYTPYPSGGYLLPTGTHTIVAKNTNDCVSPLANITVNTQPTTASAPIPGLITQPNCSVSTGSVDLNNLPAGNWIINPGAITGNTTSTTISGLASGTYNFTVTNAEGCTSPGSVNVNINTVFGAPAAPEIIITQPTCLSATGNILITSATTGLTFSLDGGPYADYPTNGFTGIATGTHTLIAQNISGCLSPFTNITVNEQPVAPDAAIVNVLQPTCTIANGTVTVTSATAGLTFSFDGGPFATYPADGYTTGAGIHTIEAQNSSGCSPAVTNNIIVNVQPASPSLTALSTPITCFGGTSIITASATGGLMPYEYSLSNGAFQPENTFVVVAGTYAITVKDSNGCDATANDIIITEPEAITLSASADTIACNGGSTTITVLTTGGTGALEYSLNSGPFQPGNLFNVVAGTYVVNVRSVNNPACTATTAPTVNVIQPEILKVSAKAKAINQCGGTTVVNVVASGGKSPYSGAGSFTKGPGKWIFSVTDANGCTATDEVTILAPGCVDLRLYPNPSAKYITVDHSGALAGASIQVFSVNGALMLNKSIPLNNYKNTIDISKLTNGNYLLIYINGNERKQIKFIKIYK